MKDEKKIDANLQLELKNVQNQNRILKMNLKEAQQNSKIFQELSEMLNKGGMPSGPVDPETLPLVQELRCICVNIGL